MKTNSVLQIKNLTKHFIDVNSQNIDIFDNINVNFAKGTTNAIVGYSGCGKSTFLQIIGLLQDADSGNLIIDEIDCSNLIKKQNSSIDRNKKSTILRQKIGFIYQFHYLFNDFNVLENLKIPLIINNESNENAEKKAIDILKRIKLEDKKYYMPQMLSGGEKQRIAIARAIIKNPTLILADEPTGNLDPETAKLVLKEMTDLVKDFQSTLIMVTHNLEMVEKFDNCYQIMNCNLVKIK